MKYETVIGLEVHVQLATASKAFCSCSTDFESAPNTNICPVCCGYPGVLPVLNAQMLALALRVSLALTCRINPQIYFERKNYFYPDLPKDYQISQYKLPLGEHGALILPSGRSIGIERVHLEEDAGKLIHKESYSLVDFNRTGIPLLEIVSRPDIRSPEEAFDYLSALKLMIQYIGASSCDMEKGYLRCDANISLRISGEKELGTKVELKNMNSFRGVRDALRFEAQRQERHLSAGENIIQETRLWDESERKTVTMRTKEEAHDYRYFPEPDLVNYSVDEGMIAEQKKYIGELPQAKRNRFLEQYKLSEKETDMLVGDIWLADFFESSVKFFADPKQVANWLLGPFFEITNSLPGGFKSISPNPENFARIVKYFAEGKLNNLSAKKVLSLFISTGKDIDIIIQQEGLTQVSGEDELVVFVRQALDENPKTVADFSQGKQQAAMFLVGQVMKKTKGKANPKVVRDLIEKLIKKGQ